MKRQMGKMNIPSSEVYDEGDDVYYVTFKTAEPSYCQEQDLGFSTLVKTKLNR